ncbi:MAG: YkgJ family cysteine cluster protein [Lachnospiraceae bacterium]|nr:YkgJ family cysteine cluster protein [Lachnospiraceae bacterium]
MKRNCSLSDISDGRLYNSNDMVKADCLECKGCSACCKGMGNSIVLDPLDIYRLCTGLGTDFNGLLVSAIELNVVDGIILPNLKMSGIEERCVFLNEDERCSIHPFRPGICRMFPLGRYYENGSYKYFLQVNECRNKNRAKIKVSKWLDTDEFKKYEKYINDWHYFLVDVQEKIMSSQEKDTYIKNINMYILNTFFVSAYNEEFYIEFDRRLMEAKNTLLK